GERTRDAARIGSGRRPSRSAPGAGEHRNELMRGRWLLTIPGALALGVVGAPGLGSLSRDDDVREAVYRRELAEVGGSPEGPTTYFLEVRRPSGARGDPPPQFMLRF